MGGSVIAAEKDLTTFQGVVMVVDFKKNTCVVNERQVQWFSNTSVSNEKGVPSSIESLKVKDWVYVEGVYDRAHKRIEARKLYLLSKRIEEKDKRLYPFIKLSNECCN